MNIDEFLHHPNSPDILNEYKKLGITYPKVHGYNMFSYYFPRTKKQIYSQIQSGEHHLGYSKRCIFDPEIDINYAWGAHSGKPIKVIKESKHADFKLFHYHDIGILHNIKKHGKTKKRMPDIKLTGGKGKHYRWGKLRILFKFANMHADTRNVFTGNKSFSTKLARLYIKLYRYIKSKPVSDYRMKK